MLGLLKPKGITSIPMQKDGIKLTINKQEKLYDWNQFEKIVFTPNFSEYSGYFLTDEFQNKTLADKIVMDTPSNLVKIRTTSSKKELKNNKSPFEHEFGTTYLTHTAFFELIDKGEKIIYATQVQKKSFGEIFNELQANKQGNALLQKVERLDGFSALCNLK